MFPDFTFAKGVEGSQDQWGKFTAFENVRDDDLVLDDALDFIIGHDADEENGIEGAGLSDYPDDKPYEEDWEDFNKFFTNLGRLLDEQSRHSVTSHILDLLDVFLDPLYTNEEISGFMHSIGKLFAYYDPNESRWVYQGYELEKDGVDYNNIYNMVKYRLPEMHRIVQNNSDHAYYSFFTIASNVFEDDGLFEFLVDETEIEGEWRESIYDVHNFLDGYYINDPESPLWPTLYDLLDDVGNLVEDCQDVDIRTVYEDYGFQKND